MRDGLGVAEAAAQAEVVGDDLVKWKRDPTFRAALRKAKREGPREPVVDLNQTLQEMIARGEGPGTEKWASETFDPVEELRREALGEQSDGR